MEGPLRLRYGVVGQVVSRTNYSVLVGFQRSHIAPPIATFRCNNSQGDSKPNNKFRGWAKKYRVRKKNGTFAATQKIATRGNRPDLPAVNPTSFGLKKYKMCGVFPTVSPGIASLRNSRKLLVLDKLF
jgi:hypothetical protein